MCLVCSKPCSPGRSESKPKSLASPVGSSSSPCVDTSVGPSPPSFLPLFCSSHACFLDSLSRYRPTPGFQTPCPQFGSLFPRESHASFLTSRYLLTLKPSLLYFSPSLLSYLTSVLIYISIISLSPSWDVRGIRICFVSCCIPSIYFVLSQYWLID